MLSSNTVWGKYKLKNQIRIVMCPQSRNIIDLGCIWKIENYFGRTGKLTNKENSSRLKNLKGTENCCQENHYFE